MEKFRHYFIRREFIVVKVDGTTCYMTPLEACEHARESDSQNTKYESCWMTQNNFEKIQDFGGF